MSYDVLDVCEYVIYYSNKKDYGISNLKLQKILYFIQAYFLINNPSRCCFGEKIEAWDIGPVIPKAYRAYKRFGGCDIPLLPEFENKANHSCILDQDKQLINTVIDKFADYSAVDLYDLTTLQSPWLDSYFPNLDREITPETIKEYFEN